MSGARFTRPRRRRNMSGKASTPASVSTSVPRPSSSSTSAVPKGVLCKFFAAGRCSRGTNCQFLHDRSKAELCLFHLQGECKFGAKCMRVHGTECETCKRPAIHPHNAQAASDHRMSCAAEQEKDTTCGVCFEQVGTPKLPTFGLLTGCEHSFCIECIRRWRRTKSQDYDVVQTCPTCRAHSEIVLPSRMFLVGDAKTRAIGVYKRHLSNIPCRHFARRRRCPFGNECLYAHRDSQGRHVQLPPPRRPCPSCGMFHDQGGGGRYYDEEEEEDEYGGYGLYEDDLGYRVDNPFLGILSSMLNATVWEPRHGYHDDDDDDDVNAYEEAMRTPTPDLEDVKEEDDEDGSVDESIREAILQSMLDSSLSALHPNRLPSATTNTQPSSSSSSSSSAAAAAAAAAARSTVASSSSSANDPSVDDILNEALDDL